MSLKIQYKIEFLLPLTGSREVLEKMPGFPVNFVEFGVVTTLQQKDRIKTRHCKRRNGGKWWQEKQNKTKTKTNIILQLITVPQKFL